MTNPFTGPRGERFMYMGTSYLVKRETTPDGGKRLVFEVVPKSVGAAPMRLHTSGTVHAAYMRFLERQSATRDRAHDARRMAKTF